MGVMKEERKEINRGVGIRFGEELRVVCETGNSAIGSGDTRCETGGGLDGKRSSKKSGDRSETGEKTHVQCVKKVHVQRRHEIIQNLPLNVACHFLDFMITDS
ncbi:hypothetical protein G5I_07882 [Acromyrmex echinatior]|uniref:Uncharacterized protein n=1 Tax=Acromyrmex echinatior TaxID=103372 RepID=F4WQ01_ACREC|nr:hypothetical protein G5I_07882 [Acromyrmex echinatior]